MKAKLVGFSQIDFQNGDGERIAGTNLFVTYPDDRVSGVKTDKFFVKDSVELPQVKLNEEINIFFNQRGKVEAITK